MPLTASDQLTFGHVPDVVQALLGDVLGQPWQTELLSHCVRNHVVNLDGLKEREMEKANESIVSWKNVKKKNMMHICNKL